MESLLPSEVARLVYGYLIEENCNEAAEKFLETSSHLKECLYVSQKGKRFQTKFEGRNLSDILDILTQIKSKAQHVAAESPQSPEFNKKLLDLFSLLSVEVNPLESQNGACVSSNSDNSYADTSKELGQGILNETREDKEYPSSSEKSVSLKRHNGHLNDVPVDSDGSSSSPGQGLGVVTSDNQNNEIPDEDSDLEITLCSSKETEESVSPNQSGDPDPASIKRIRLDDDATECRESQVEVIDLEDDDTSNSSASTDSAQHVRSSQYHPGRRKGRNRRKYKIKNKDSNGKNEEASLHSHIHQVSSSSNGPSSVIGQVLLRTTFHRPPLALNPSLIRGAPLRFIPHVTRHPIGTRWIGGPSLPVPPPRPSLPVMVKRRVIQTSSSFGVMGSSRPPGPSSSNFHMVTEKVVTQMLSSNDQPRISQSVLTNQTFVRPSLITVIPRERFM